MCAGVVLKTCCGKLRYCHTNDAPMMPKYMNRMLSSPLIVTSFPNPYASRRRIANFPRLLASPPQVRERAEDCADHKGFSQHHKDGSGADGDSHQLHAVAHERTSTMESGSWSRWCGDLGGVGGRGRFDRCGDLLDLAIGDLLDGRGDGGNG